MKIRAQVLRLREFGIFLVFIGLVILFSFLSPHFLKVTNIFNITKQIATLAIVSVGFTFVLITGGIDLSVGYQISLVNVVCAYLMVKSGLHPAIAVLIVIVMGTLIGFINGLIIIKTGVAPLIVTLAVMSMLNGLSFMISKGIPIFGYPKSFSIIGQGSIGVVPISLIIMLVIIFIGTFILIKTYFGRYFYAIGSNVEAAKLSGVDVGRIKILVYTLCGFFTAIAGVIMLSRINSGLSITGGGFEFSVLTACVLGGVSINGGKGTMMGAFIGVLIIGVLNNGLILLNIGEYAQLVLRGFVLLLAVVYDTMSRDRSERVKRIKAIDIAKELP
jgi:Ribose/xylose/arabinose/galactoside ABC-type transport systems, permease components